MRAYLAGPDVFLPNALEVAAKKKSVCHEFGFEGVFPVDSAIELDTLSEAEKARAIFRSNLETMNSCDIIFANLSPFRGVSADPGTVFELGYMFGLNKPVCGYSSSIESYKDRVEKLIGIDKIVFRHGQKFLLDKDSYTVENFNLNENLMIPLSIEYCHGHLEIFEEKDKDSLAAMTAFRECVGFAAQNFLPKAAVFG